MPVSSPWRSVFSLGTLLTGLLMIAALSLEYGWAAGALLVLLLYVHEIGHVFVALWRRVPVDRAPTFVPGLGAFVVIRSSRPWESALVAAGGPVIGGAAALVAKLTGLAIGSQPLAFAGDFALWLNWINLFPVSILDGGRILAGAGWLGVLPGGLVAITGFVTSNMGLVVLGLLMAIGPGWRSMDEGDRTPPLRPALAAILLYLAVAAALSATFLLEGRVAAVVAVPDGLTPIVQRAVWLCVGAYIVSWMGWRTAWSPYTAPWYRYIFLTLLGWPNFLLRNAWFIPVPVIALAHLLGLPGSHWLERFIGARAPRNCQAAGMACAAGYDVLAAREGPGAARAWLDRMLPAAVAGGVWVLEAAASDLGRLGHKEPSHRWQLAEAEQGYDPARLPAMAANNIAWTLLLEGRAEAALPYARAAVDTTEPKPGHLDTLGRVLLETGAHAEAEVVLRRTLHLENDPGTRVVLARAIAAQGRPAEAAKEARTALDGQRGPWPEYEPSTGQIELWIADWTRPEATSVSLPSPQTDGSESNR